MIRLASAMNRRTVLVIIAASCAAPAQAEAQRLTAPEITALLSDRKITGDWNGTPYSQSFAATGHTVYIPRGGRPDAGRWRVNAETNEYESYWERSGWSSYAIEQDGDTLYWVDPSGARHPFEVVP